MARDMPTKIDERFYKDIQLGEGAVAVVGDRDENTTTTTIINPRTYHTYLTRLPVSGSNTTDEKGAALLVAAHDGRASAVKQLLQSGADPCHSGEDGQTALFKAVTRGHEDTVDVLLDSCENKSVLLHKAERRHLDTPLHRAAVNGSTTMVQKLLSHGALLEKLQRDNCTALHLAAARGHDTIVRLLLERGANHAAENAHGGTPLHVAARGGRLQVLKVLLDHDPSTHYLERTNEWSDTALFLCALHGHEDCARELIARGANVHVRNNDWNSLLHVTCFMATPNLLEVLLPRFAGPDFFARNHIGQTPMDVAQNHNRPRCIALLRTRMA